MKKRFPVYFILLLVASLGALTSWFAFTTQPSDWTNAPATTVEIQQDSLDLKTIHYDDHPQVTYTIKNTGTHPLIIKDVQTSCGCTDPHWDKRPVLPGKTGTILVTFKPNSLGRFTKTIQVLCNTSPVLHELKLEGHVIE